MGRAIFTTEDTEDTENVRILLIILMTRGNIFCVISMRITVGVCNC